MKVDLTIKVLFVSIFILTVCATELIVFGGLGIGVVLTVAAYFGCIYLYGKQLGKKQNMRQMGLGIIAVMTTICFVLFSNPILRVCNILFLGGVLLIHGIDCFNKSEYEAFSLKWWLEVVGIGSMLPFLYLCKPVEIVKTEVKEGKQEKVKTLGKMVIGLILAVPFLIVMMFLLISADAAFSGVVEVVFEKVIDLNIAYFVARVVVGSLLFFCLFSYFYGLGYGKKENEKIESGDRKIEIADKNEKVDFTILATMGTLLCMMYLVFCLSQSVYFVSAFKGVLPEEFSFAEYARRGFFETLPIAAFNLAAIATLNLVVDCKEQIGKIRYIHGMSTFIGGFTLFMTICAFSKMALYMGQYGLTLKRVEVAWFLAVIAMMIIMTIIKIYRTQFKLLRNLFIGFTIMYLGLNYVNIDYQVAHYNVNLYRQGIMSELSGMEELSTSAAGPLEQIVLETQDDELNESVRTLLEGYKEKLSNQKWQDWNVADHYVEKISNKMLG